jgi:hypothetical protein
MWPAQSLWRSGVSRRRSPFVRSLEGGYAAVVRKVLIGKVVEDHCETGRTPAVGSGSVLEKARDVEGGNGNAFASL